MISNRFNHKLQYSVKYTLNIIQHNTNYINIVTVLNFKCTIKYLKAYLCR